LLIIVNKMVKSLVKTQQNTLLNVVYVSGGGGRSGRGECEVVVVLRRIVLVMFVIN